jgi:Flp pilus assembly protein TadD
MRGTPLFWIACAAAGFSGLWLLGPARRDAGTVTLVHLSLGLLPALAWWLTARNGRRDGGDPAARPAAQPAHPQRRVLRPWLLLAALAAGAVLSGLAMAVLAASGWRADRPPWVAGAHAAAGILLTLASVVAVPRQAAPGRVGGRGGRAAVFVAGGLVLMVAASPLVAAWRRPAAMPEYDADAYYRSLTSTNRRQAGTLFFPAGGRPVSEAEEARCGEGNCHPREWQEWRASRHARAAASPYYREALRAFRATSPDREGLWCQGCHGRSPDGTDVGCISCHGIRAVRSLAGNGQCTREGPAATPFPGQTWTGAAWMRGFLIRLRPHAHDAEFTPTDLAVRSEFCAPCHRMSLSVAQNRYRFLRAQDEYGTWQNSFVSGDSAHGFAPPLADGVTCQSCHMPRRAGSASHACPSAGGTPGAVSIDVGSLRAVDQATSGPEEELAALPPHRPGSEPASGPPPVSRPVPGRVVVASVVVANHGVGHEFPAGISDAKDVWIEFEARDTGKGDRVLFRSGGTGASGEADPEAHAFGLFALDRTGRRVEGNRLHEMVTPLFHRAVGPGEADVARYRFRLPAGTRGPLRLRARLLYRSVSARFHALLAGEGISAPLPELRVLGESEALVAMGAPRPGWGQQGRAGAAAPRPGDGVQGTADRFYDYGVGLLLQGDLPRAASAMRRVQELQPRDARGFLGLGRVYLQEGDLLAARSQFEAAQARVAPGATTDPRPAAFLATVYRRMGEYDRCLRILEPLAHRFPRDRLLLFDAGMAHFRSGRNAEAAETFRRMLAIDPDDVAAHYNLMLCLQRLNRIPEARREETIYRYLKEDESVRQVVGAYLRAHPTADREVQSIHEHGG